MKEFFTNYIGEFLVALIAGFGGWFFERKRRAAETKGAKSDAIQSMQSAYDAFVEDYEQKYEELTIEVNRLKAELRRTKTYWKNRYDALEKEFEEYKELHP